MQSTHSEGYAVSTAVHNVGIIVVTRAGYIIAAVL